MKKFVNRWKKAAALAITAVTVIGAMAGCGASSQEENKGAKSSAQAEDQSQGGTDVASLNQADHLNIATQPAPAYLPLEILKDKGWLEEALKEAGYDIEVTFTSFESGPPENESFAAGQQDVGVMGNVPSISAVAAGQDRTFIGISANGEHTQAVLVPTDSDITSVADLKGKKIGLVVGSISQNLLDTLFKDAGLSIADVELINLSTGEQQEALATGQVDAVATWEPTLTKIQANGIGKILADGTGLFLGENTIFARTDYINENPKIVKIFFEQYARAAKELKDNLDQYAEQYAEYYGVEPELLKTVLENHIVPIVISEDDTADLQGTADFLYDSGIVSERVDVADHVDYSYSEALE